MASITVYKGSENGAIVEAKVEKPKLKADEVLLQVTHSGLCGTDVHYKGADMVLGHEGVGVVEAVGSGVTLFKKGDRAGWGYNHHCCGHCEQCLSGNDVYCPERQMYGDADLDQGSMASHATWSESFLFHIPEEMASDHAAPLQCGGVTVSETTAKCTRTILTKAGIQCIAVVPSEGGRQSWYYRRWWPRSSGHSICSEDGL